MEHDGFRDQFRALLRAEDLPPADAQPASPAAGQGTTVVITGDHNQVILGCQSCPLSEDAQSNPRAEGRTPGSSVGAAAGWALSGFMRAARRD